MNSRISIGPLTSRSGHHLTSAATATTPIQGMVRPTIPWMTGWLFVVQKNALPNGQQRAVAFNSTGPTTTSIKDRHTHIFNTIHHPTPHIPWRRHTIYTAHWTTTAVGHSAATGTLSSFVMVATTTAFPLSTHRAKSLLYKYDNHNRTMPKTRTRTTEQRVQAIHETCPIQFRVSCANLFSTYASTCGQVSFVGYGTEEDQCWTTVIA